MRALITGGSDGLGAAVVRHLTQAGAQVWIIDKTAPQTNQSLRFLPCDLAQPDDLAGLPARLQQAGPFDLVVMSAGINAVGPFEAMPLATIRNLHDINCAAPILLAQHLLAQDLIAAGGRLVFIASVSHFTGYPGASVYAGGKDALVAFARSLRRPLWADHRTTVQVATPAPMRNRPCRAPCTTRQHRPWAGLPRPRRPRDPAQQTARGDRAGGGVAGDGAVRASVPRSGDTGDAQNAVRASGMNRLVLIGAGLVHLEVLRRLTTTRFPDTEITLISKDSQAVYAGMLPGVVAGHYAPEQMTVDAARLAAAAKVGFRQGAISGLDLAGSAVILADGAALDFTHLSLNVGAWPRDIGLARAVQSLSIKPAPAFVDALQAWERQAAPAARVGVIGGGAAGAELVLALAHRWRDSRPAPILIERSGLRLDRIAAAARRPLRRHLARAGIAVHTPDTAPDLALAINAAGAAPPGWLAQTGLARNALGYLAIGPSLQVTGQDRIFASGDVASMADHPRAKAGVFAVRQGPVLFANLQRALAGEPLLAHRPQTDWLSLIGTGPKHAIATRNGIALQGRWVWRIKDINDRSYLARYRAIVEKDSP